MHQASFHLETLTCPSCLQTIHDNVANLTGVIKESLDILYTGSCVKLNFDSDVISMEEIEKVINNSDCEVLESRVEPYAETKANA